MQQQQLEMVPRLMYKPAVIKLQQQLQEMAAAAAG
jgi:hypothetical protein